MLFGVSVPIQAISYQHLHLPLPHPPNLQLFEIFFYNGAILLTSIRTGWLGLIDWLTLLDWSSLTNEHCFYTKLQLILGVQTTEDSHLTLFIHDVIFIEGKIFMRRLAHPHKFYSAIL